MYIRKPNKYGFNSKDTKYHGLNSWENQQPVKSAAIQGAICITTS